MKDGFIRVAASTPEVKVADVEYNREQICCRIIEGRERGAKIMVFPELVLTGYTCGELFNQKPLLTKAREELKKLVDFTAGKRHAGICRCSSGSIITSSIIQPPPFRTGSRLPLFPKCACRTILNSMSRATSIRDLKSRWQFPGRDGYVLMGSKILFNCANVENLVVGAEICEGCLGAESAQYRQMLRPEPR